MSVIQSMQDLDDVLLATCRTNLRSTDAIYACFR